MAMAVGPASGEDEVMSAINTTPLVDVMLVLLIIFLITIPVVNSSIAVNLPREASHESQALPQNIIVTVDAQGAVYWFDQPVPSTDMLAAALRTASSSVLCAEPITAPEWAWINSRTSRPVCCSSQLLTR